MTPPPAAVPRPARSPVSPSVSLNARFIASLPNVCCMRQLNVVFWATGSAAAAAFSAARVARSSSLCDCVCAQMCVCAVCDCADMQVFDHSPR